MFKINNNKAPGNFNFNFNVNFECISRIILTYDIVSVITLNRYMNIGLMHKINAQCNFKLMKMLKLFLRRV